MLRVLLAPLPALTRCRTVRPCCTWSSGQTARSRGCTCPAARAGRRVSMLRAAHPKAVQIRPLGTVSATRRFRTLLRKALLAHSTQAPWLLHRLQPLSKVFLLKNTGEGRDGATCRREVSPGHGGTCPHLTITDCDLNPLWHACGAAPVSRLAVSLTTQCLCQSWDPCTHCHNRPHPRTSRAQPAGVGGTAGSARNSHGPN